MKISVATVAVWLAFIGAGQPPAPPPKPVPAACCKECNGTGMVWSGDGVARVFCPCPPTCPCAKNRPKMQCSGPSCAAGGK